MTHQEGDSANRDWLVGGGEMGALMRSFDFSRTPLGAVSEWPQSLRSAVSICLNSRFPIVLFWGPQFISLYNDAYIPILGSKHPWALGRPFEVVWADIWDVLGPVLRSVFETGVPSWAEDQQLIFQRSGYPEEVYFTFSFGAGRNERGDVGGIFCAVTETTQRVLHERRLAILKELSAEARTTPEAARIIAEVLGHTPDIPFALLYLTETDGVHAVLASHCGLPEESTAAQARIALTHEQEPWRLSCAQSDGMIVLTGLDRRVGPLPGRPWPESATSAVVIPLKQAGQSEAAGYLVLGISPRRAFDEAYRRFFELVGNHAATMVSNARAYEDERRRAEALAELDRAKTAFFSNVSHEFRTPLTLMLGPIEELLARSHTDLSPSAKGQLEIVNRNGLRLLRLVNSLLDFSRIEAGRVQARYEPVDLSTFTAELASSFRSATQRAGLKLIVDCPPLSQSVYIDRDMWEKIVLNLISNAFKFTFEGEIVVMMRQRERAAELVVRDTGVGIPAEALPKLFERFYQVENMRSRTHEGSGIGLALVQELVKLHGGSVHAESKMGEGSSFRISIPFGSAHLPASQSGGPRIPAPTALGASPFVEEALRWLPDESPGENEEALLPDDFLAMPPAAAAMQAGCPRILLADDNADMRQYVARLLAERYAVEAVGDGEAALAAARAHRPDLILSDVMMPKLDGFGLLREVRNDPSLQTVPVIMLSARAGEESRVGGLEHGADDYLIKPFSARELMARIQSHLAMARIRKETDSRAVEDLQDMTRLYEVGNRCVRAGNFMQERLDEIVNTAIAVTRADRGNLQLFDADGALTIAAHSGFDKPFLTFFVTVKNQAAACDEARRRAARVVVDDVLHSPIFDGTPALQVLLDAGVRACQSTPLVSSTGHVIGMISTHFSRPHRPNERELRIMDLLALQASDYLERKQAEQALALRSRQRQVLYELASAVNRSDEAAVLYERALDAILVSLNATRASILLFDDHGVMRFQAWRELSEAYRAAVEGHSPWTRGHDNPAPILVPDVATSDIAPGLRATILQEGIEALAFIPLTYSDRVIGKFMVYYDKPHVMNDEDIELALGIGTTLAIGIQRARSDQALRVSESQLRELASQLETRVDERTKELVQSQDRLRGLTIELSLAEQRERKRLAMELHDHLQQILVLAKLTIGHTKRAAYDLPACQKAFDKLDGLLGEALTYTRTLGADLSPPVLRDHGLAAGLKWLGESMSKHDLRVIVTVPDDESVTLSEDQTVLLFQSVRELLINASKHAGTGEASVAMAEKEGRLEIIVRDQGGGFDLAAAAAAEGSNARGGLSSKFGLFSIRERMSAIGGWFEIRSAVGKGTTATLALPIGARQQTSHNTRSDTLVFNAGNHEKEETIGKEARVRVLLVDDHAMVRQGLRAILEAYADVQVVGDASDGIEALTAVDRLHPRVILMDINMPNKNGIEVTAEIKARYPQIPIIGLSVNAGRENQEAMLKAGASMLLTKEAAVDQLYTAIQKVIKATSVAT